MSEEWAIAILANVVVIIIAAVGGAWHIGNIKSEVLEVMTAHARDDANEFTEIRSEIDSTARAFGETIASIRQHINNVDLAAAQNYIRREGFYKSMEAMGENIANMRKEIREDLLRLESKITQRG